MSDLEPHIRKLLVEWGCCGTECEAEASLTREAFKAGAAAMRERAAQVVYSAESVDELTDVGDRIRELPLGEEG